MPRPTALLKRSLIFIHRWLGVGLSVIFLLWFVSGIVMMYWTYPAVGPGDRLQRLPTLDPAQIALSPEDAYATLGRDQPPGQVRLTSFDGRPVYRFAGAGRGGGGRGGGRGGMVHADDGTAPGAIDDAMIDRAASRWTGQPTSEARKESIEEVDQWTVGALRNTRPLYKYSWPDGQQVYVNGNTGEVAQYTTTSSRFWAYLGAIPHWLYFTPLRKHPAEWFSVVVWSSLIGTISAIVGIVIILWMYSPRKRYRYVGAPTSIPYSGWKRWHAVAGLLFGVITTTWAFSGMLSMGPFPITDKLTELTVPSTESADGGAADEGPDLGRALRGSERLQLSAYAARSPAAAIASVPGFEVKEIEFTSFDGEPVYLATNGGGETRIIPLDGPAKTTFAPDEIMRVVREAVGPALGELRLMEQYDAYYRDRRREAPLPVVYARMNDAVGTRYYIDPATARVVSSYNARNWISRWLYNGLHSLDFPWLYNYRPLWDIVVIALMLGGTALCITSLVLTWRVIARRLAAVVRARLNQPNEDLAVEMKS